MNKEDLKIGCTYRAKRPSRVGPFGEPNDRTIIYIGFGGHEIQYDGPAVRWGQNYPKTTADKFLKWASHKVVG